MKKFSVKKWMKPLKRPQIFPRLLLFIIAMLLAAPALWGEVFFDNLHLSEDNKLLFSAITGSPVFGEYSTLLKADIKDSIIEQKTFFPERITLIDGNERLQIQNRFGVFRTDKDLAHMSVVKEFPSFVSGTEIQRGKLLQLHASPDGRYLLFQEPASFAYADLILFDVANESKHIITGGIGLSYDVPTASWSPDSRYFIYTKNNNLYYYSIDQLHGNRVITEEYRKIGRGTISSLAWSPRNNLYYIKGSLVYQILSAELFTRTLYREVMDIGLVVGKIPFNFDNNFDSFYISPDGGRILLNKGGGNLILYYLQEDDYLSTGKTVSLPYLFLPRNNRVKEVIWSEDNIITILTGGFKQGELETAIFRIDLREEDAPLFFTRMDAVNVKDIVLSPNEASIAMIKKDEVVIKSYHSWDTKAGIEHSQPLHLLWRTNQDIIIAGNYITELYSLSDQSRRVIALSQAGGYAFDTDGNVATQLDNNTFRLDIQNPQRIAAFNPRGPVGTTDEYRVFLEERAGRGYKNIVMVRNIKGFGTKRLFAEPRQKYQPFPDKEDPVNFDYFTHGSRIRRREVALVFNAIDSVEGLAEVLNTLEEYGIRATFFVNGQFIRRNPDAVRELAHSRHEIGSLFNNYFNMTDVRFKVDDQFIKRGLAQNEDDYFSVTNRELSLLWHAPYYFVNSAIISASKEMNYTYAGRDVDPLDWVARDSFYGASLYRPSREIVEQVLEKKLPGSIIPIRIGIPESGRDDYLFLYLDLLINGLISQGYEIVPVTTLIENAK